MKTIFYTIIAIFICITLTSVTHDTYKAGKVVVLQATGSNITSQFLEESKMIISERLKVYGQESSDIVIMAAKGQIKIQLPVDSEISDIEGLLTAKGELALYETFNQTEIADLLKNNSQLTDLMQSDRKLSPSDPRIGCITPENGTKVNEYLRLNKPGDGIRFYWSIKAEKSQICLYALKTDVSNKPLLMRSDIESIKSSHDKNSQSFLIEMKFFPAAAKMWSDATKRDLDRSIAIVIDDKVFYDPIVRTVIENGLCEISGNMTLKDVNYFLALVNNKPLPVSFILLK